MRVVQKFLAYRDEQEKQLEIGLKPDGKPFALGDVTTVNLTLLNVRRSFRCFIHAISYCINPQTFYSCNPLNVQGGVQYNVVPQEVTAGLDIRVTPNVNLKEFEAEIRRWVASEPG
ncbi:hypothetical protein BC936DRAFT_140465 [Jimgerdemannia flammicorona]|nr:hypothetical protein BC936DRAFT_140465 [Jimgerdemannia flammicorona]